MTHIGSRGICLMSVADAAALYHRVDISPPMKYDPDQLTAVRKFLSHHDNWWPVKAQEIAYHLMAYYFKPSR